MCPSCLDERETKWQPAPVWPLHENKCWSRILSIALRECRHCYLQDAKKMSFPFYYCFLEPLWDTAKIMALILDHSVPLQVGSQADTSWLLLSGLQRSILLSAVRFNYTLGSQEIWDMLLCPSHRRYILRLGSLITCFIVIGFHWSKSL